LVSRAALILGSSGSRGLWRRSRAGATGIRRVSGARAPAGATSGP